MTRITRATRFADAVSKVGDAKCEFEDDVNKSYKVKIIWQTKK